MRYAILGDVHGNWEALNAVLKDARTRGAEAYACIGDVVGYNPDPGPCLARLRDLDCSCVQGNHDEICGHAIQHQGLSEVAAAALQWTREQLDAEQMAFLRGLKRRTTLDGFSLVHNTLNEIEEWQYVFGIAEAMMHFRRQQCDVCFHGHTHVPAVFSKHRRITMDLFHAPLDLRPEVKYFINVGSVGQPRDRDPRAAYVLYDLDRRRVEIRRVTYDLAATQRKILAAGLPEWLAFRLELGT